MRPSLPILILTLALVGCPPPETELVPDADPGVVGVAEPDPRFFGPAEHIVHLADEVEWRPGPESLPEGSEIAVLEGDPSDSGIFVMRLAFPEGYRIPPHWHPNFERVTVLEGTFHLGTGTQFDEEATRALPAGSFTVMPPQMEHFAHVQERTVIEITSVGPWEVNYVDPADDPRG